MDLIAKLPTTGRSNAKQLDKEIIRKYHVVGCKLDYPGTLNGDLVSVLTANIYMSRSGDGASPVYCALWVHATGVCHTSGKGTASGYGYHKTSAAIDAALTSAGIELFDSKTGNATHIDGVGDSAIEDAFIAIGKACGLDSVLILS